MLKKCSFLLFILLHLSLVGQASEVKMRTPEEETTRNTYAKVSLAAQIGLLVHSTVLRSEGWPSLADEAALRQAMSQQVRFNLTHFQVGDVADVADIKWKSLLTVVPDASIQLTYQDIPVTFQTRSSESVKHVVFADIAWARNRLSQGQQSSDPTVGETLHSLAKPSGVRWKRYASFSVELTLQERTINYRALFLFGTDTDGQLTILPIDYVVQSAISYFITDRMYPALLLETALRDVPLIHDWIQKNQVSGCKKEKAPEVCCESTTEKCGIASEDVRRSLEMPVELDSKWLDTVKKGEK